MITAKVTDSPISVSNLMEIVKSQSAGACVTFSGDVRDHDKGRAVISLKYEIHPSAQKVIEEIVAKVASLHQVLSVAAVHRYGLIPIGDSAFVVAVSAAHREAAFQCCMEIVERVKLELPIWKYQEFADGSNEWVNSA